MSSEEGPSRKPRYPSDVIKDAKNWCALRAINTKRPSTPLEVQRSLFGGDSHRLSRPPSTYSLNSHHFDPSDPSSRPNSGVIQPVAPIKPKLEPLKVKPVVPSIDRLVTPSSKKSFSAAQGGRKQSSSDLNYHHATSSAANLPVKAYTSYSSSNLKTQKEDARTDESPNSNNSNNNVRYHPQPSTNNKPIRPERCDFVGGGERMKLSAESSSSSSAGGGEGGESKEEALYWNTKVLPLLEQLEDSANKEASSLCKSCGQLYEALMSGGGVRVEGLMSRRRTSLLTALFRLLNVPSNDLHVKCARIILSAGVNSKNLTSICKLLFRIARDRDNDRLFVDNRLIEPMLSLLRETDNASSRYEALVYLCGSIKFLSENKAVAGVLYASDCIPIITTFAHNLVKVVEQTGQKRAHKQALDILVQITEAFRNMLDADKKVQQSQPSIPTMVEILHHFYRDHKLAWIMSRIFSKLTVYESSVKYLVTCGRWCEVIVATMRSHEERDEVMVRLCFVLGNILSDDHMSRHQIFFHRTQPIDGQSRDGEKEEERSELLELLLRVLQRQADAESSNSDVIIKAIRVVANMSMSHEVGKILSTDSRLVHLLLHIIERSSLSSSSSSSSGGEEIMTNALVALNNLAYYDNDDAQDFDPHRTKHTSAVHQHRVEIATMLIKLMLEEDMMSYIVEISRVLGNITKYRDVRDLIRQHKVDVMMTTLLDSGDGQVVYNSCGVLVNLSGDIDQRAHLIQQNIIPKLTDVMRDFTPCDWMIAGITCQLVWNLIAGDSSGHVVDDWKQVEELKKTLRQLQDEVEVGAKVREVCGEDAGRAGKIIEAWRSDFCQFARPLHARVNSLTQTRHNLVPLDE